MDRKSSPMLDSALNSLANIEPAVNIDESKEDMMSFTNFFHKNSPAIAKSEAVFVNLRQTWRAFVSALSDDVEITAEEQTVSHPIFASKEFDNMVPQRQRRSRKTPYLIKQHD